MGEKLIVGIQQMTISAATYHGVPITPTYINYFFGNNGVGKTTISREIAKLKRPANEVSGGIEPQGVAFEPGKTFRDYNILVYNQDFINANLQQLDSLPGVFTIDEESIKQQTDINNTVKEKQDVEKEYAELIKQRDFKKAAISTLGTALETDCWNRTKDVRERFPETQGGCKQKKSFLAKVQSIQNAQNHDFEELGTLYDTAYDKNARTYRLFDTIANISLMEEVPGLDLLGKRIVSSSDTDFAKFIKALNATDWIRQGHERYHETAGDICPYCQQPMPTTFETDLANCFDEGYQSEVQALTDLLQNYKDAGNGLWKTLQDSLMDVFPQIDVTEYKDKMTILKGVIASNIQKIDQKLKEPSSEVEIESISPYLDEINSIIGAFNRKITEHNDIVNMSKEKKKECLEHVWELLAYQVSDIVKEYNKNFSQLMTSYQAIETEAGQKQTYINTLDGTISELSKHVVNTTEAINNMKKMLNDSGFQGFTIRENPGAKNQYQIVREDGSVAKQLSEGERNFIAFLYFCNLVHGKGSTADAQHMVNTDGEMQEITDGRDMRDKIVVIDDPVSSMDSSALFIVSSLVRQMIVICQNNVTLEDKVEKGDYIKQMFILTHNAYFHREIIVNQEKNYKSVSFYLITKNDNKSAIKHCITKNENIPTEMRNYNPVQNSYAALWTEYKEVCSSITLKNVIRRILEYYFIQICGYDGYTLKDIILNQNRKMFVKIDEITGEEDTSDLQTVSALIGYITASSFGVNEGLHFIDDCIAPEIYRELTEKIFKAMNQTQHYEMMANIFIRE